jgi:hypothetical protein
MSSVPASIMARIFVLASCWMHLTLSASSAGIAFGAASQHSPSIAARSSGVEEKYMPSLTNSKLISATQDGAACKVRRDRQDRYVRSVYQQRRETNLKLAKKME